jgi:hypothetical protein
MLLLAPTPLLAYSDCSSTIRRTQQALYSLGPAVGHLQHGTLLLGIRSLASKYQHSTTLVWTPSHPERFKPQHQLTDNDWEIHLADEITCEPLESPTATAIARTFHCDSKALYVALTSPHQAWLPQTTRPTILISAMHQNEGYEPSRWIKYCAPPNHTLLSSW